MRTINTAAEMDEALRTHQTVLCHFRADWCEPCAHMDTVCAQLGTQHSGLEVLLVDAEALGDVSERFAVETVPTFILFSEGAVAGKLVGADAPALVALVAELQPTAAEPLTDRLRKLVSGAPVMLFMKGSPDEPRCGFSRQMVELLREEGVDFSHFDILADEEVRQGLKTFSNWPTYPQLYAKGTLVGGLDIAKELKEEGELREALGV